MQRNDSCQTAAAANPAANISSTYLLYTMYNTFYLQYILHMYVSIYMCVKDWY